MWNVVHRMAPRTLLRKLQSTWRDHLEERRLLAVMRAERDEFLAADGGRFEPGADWPCLRDRRASIPFDRHYFYHPAWACRVLRSIDPAHHVDISSIFSFAGCVSAFWPTTYYEYQPPVVSLDRLETGVVDLCKLPFPDASIASLSCMHVVEHVGLGRYGDALDPDGDIRAAGELARVLAPGGHLLFVAPLAGRARLEFNAHRIYSYEATLGLFPGLRLAEFALVCDPPCADGLIRHADPARLEGQRFACGCFHFIRPVDT